MRNAQWLDKLLLKIDKQNVIHLFKEGLPPEDIADILNTSEPFVNDTIEEYKFQFRQERWAEVQGCD